MPLIFVPTAEDLAGRVAEAGPGDVLENAAGTGVLTRALAARLPATARLVATDLNGAMLDEAAARQPPRRAVDWRPADMTALPFPDASFDAVGCQFGVMFVPDEVAAYAEGRRVLRPSGRFLFNVWDRIEANDFAACAQEILRERFRDDPSLFMTRTAPTTATASGTSSAGPCPASPGPAAPGTDGSRRNRVAAGGPVRQGHGDPIGDDPMSFRITGLPADEFRHLFSLSDEDLAVQGAVRRTADDRQPGYPCRVSLTDSRAGDELVLVNYEHHPVASPYRMRFAVYVRPGEDTFDAVGEVPEQLRLRTLAVRGFDRDGMMTGWELVEGAEIEGAIERLLGNPKATYLHAHYAAPGCYAARIDRA